MAKKTSSDPTGQRVNRARASRALKTKLNASKREVIALFRAVPKSRRVVNAVVWGYDLNPQQAEILNNQIRSVLKNNLLQTQGETMPINWWFQKYVEIPYRQGTIESLNEINRLISIAESQGMVGAGGVAAQRIAPEIVLSSQLYLDELRNMYVENFQQIKSLSDTTASQVITKINSGMNAGLSSSEITDEITQRFNVSVSNADRISRTEVNRAYNEARIRATRKASDISGFDAKVRHISALLPKRTRKSHAARHYNVYTMEEQERWWARDANRINCLCYVRSILIGADGNYIER